MTPPPAIPDRVRTLAGVAAGIAAAIAAAAVGISLPATLVWNVTESVPEGLYRVARDRLPATGEIAVAWLPADAARLASERHYLPLGVPLLKPVAAGPGHSVCRSGDILTIDGTVRATALDRDSRGRPLPRWAGCTVLPQSRIFLMNAAVPSSFDGRYFGPLPVGSVTGRAIPVFTRDAVTSTWRLHLIP